MNILYFFLRLLFRFGVCKTKRVMLIVKLKGACAVYLKRLGGCYPKGTLVGINLEVF